MTTYSQLHGVYDASASDRFDGHTLGSLIGRTFRYEGSDGQRHFGCITAICENREGDRNLVAVFSSGYSDGHWTSLARAVESLDA